MLPSKLHLFANFLPIYQFARNVHIGICLQALHDPARFRKERWQSRSVENEWHRDLEGWTEKNEALYPPMNEEEGIRPAEIYHGRAKIRYSTKKFFHLCALIKNMDIDEAIYKLDYINKKGAKIIREILLEAQEIAVKDHNVEFKSNLHIVHSFACKHSSLKFPIYRAMGRKPCIGTCPFSSYYVLLREGPAPFPKPRMTALEKAFEYVEILKDRKIADGL